MRWIPPEQAPKDGTIIIGNFHDVHPERIVCMWDSVKEHWVGAYPQSDPVDGRHFQNEYFHTDDLVAWAEL